MLGGLGVYFHFYFFFFMMKHKSSILANNIIKVLKLDLQNNLVC